MSAVPLEVIYTAAAELDRQPVAQGPDFQLKTAIEVLSLPPLRYILHGFIPTEGVGVIYGASTTGKSFVEVGLAAAMAEGESFFGYRVGHKGQRQFRVVMVVLEGRAGLQGRLRAWEKANGRPYPSGVLFLLAPFQLNVSEHRFALAAKIEAVGGADVVFIDTLNQATPGYDENNARDASLTIAAAQELQRAFGGFLMLIAHTGKDTTRGLRGHSSVFAAVDVALEVSRSGDLREWRASKVKDGRDGVVHPFRLEGVSIGQDEDGSDVTSCVVREAIGPAAKPRPAPPASGNQRIVWDALGPLLRESKDFGKAGAPAQRPCVLLEVAIEQIKGRLPVDQKRRTERCGEAIRGLVSRQLLACNEGWLWLP